MAPKSKANLPVVTGDRAALLAAAGVQSTAAADFASYAEGRDEILGTPFAVNKSLARTGALFTIVKAIERQKIAPTGSDREGQTLETFLYLIRLQSPYEAVNETTGEVKTFAEGSAQLLELEQAIGPRQRDFEKLSTLLFELDKVGDENGVPNFSLQEYPSTKPMRANSYGLIDAARWRTVQEVARERGIAK